jgi:hypothetical protein
MDRKGFNISTSHPWIGNFMTQWESKQEYTIWILISHSFERDSSASGERRFPDFKMLPINFFRDGTAALGYDRHDTAAKSVGPRYSCTIAGFKAHEEEGCFLFYIP